jgi:ketosteroid isomerase-like protein
MTTETSKVLIKNGEIIKTLYDNFKAVNIPAVLEQMDPEMSWTEAEGYIYGGTYVGADAILENVFKKLATEWEGFTAAPEKIVDGRDTVVAIGRYSGKYLKTGKSVDVPFAHVWTFNKGRITSFVQHTDTLVIARQLGLIQ